MWEAWRKQICLLTPPTNSLGHRDGVGLGGGRLGGWCRNYEETLELERRILIMNTSFARSLCLSIFFLSV